MLFLKGLCMGIRGGVGLTILSLDSLGLSSMGVYIFMQDVKVKPLLLQASVNTRVNMARGRCEAWPCGGQLPHMAPSIHLSSQYPH